MGGSEGRAFRLDSEILLLEKIVKLCGALHSSRGGYR